MQLFVICIKAYYGPALLQHKKKQYKSFLIESYTAFLSIHFAENPLIYIFFCVHRIRLNVG